MKKVTIKEGELTLVRFEERQKFFCERCNADKEAKVVVTWKTNDGQEKKICNGCYGWLLSQNK